MPSSKKQRWIAEHHNMSAGEHDFLVHLAEDHTVEVGAQWAGWRVQRSVAAKVYALLKTLGLPPQGCWENTISALRAEAKKRHFQNESLYGMHNEDDQCDCELCLEWFGPLADRRARATAS